jgi:hypothetical protein
MARWALAVGEGERLKASLRRGAHPDKPEMPGGMARWALAVGEGERLKASLRRGAHPDKPAMLGGVGAAPASSRAGRSALAGGLARDVLVYRHRHGFCTVTLSASSQLAPGAASQREEPALSVAERVPRAQRGCFAGAS